MSQALATANQTDQRENYCKGGKVQMKLMIRNYSVRS
jgi:hypothetical protein